jgi:hypothetical protein
MRIGLEIHTEQLDTWMRLVPRRLPAGAAYAINRTIDRTRIERLFPHIRSRVIIRGPERDEMFFGTLDRPGGAAGKFPRADRATAQRLYATFGTASMERKRWGAKGGPILLAGLETGEMREPMAGSKSIAVPLIGRPARPSIAGPVPPAMRIANLKMRAHYRGSKIVRKMRGGHRRGLSPFNDQSRYNFHGVQGVQWKGLQHTFTLTHSEHQPLGGIYQRFERGTWDRGLGRMRGGIREIYRFIPPFRLDTSLQYYLC